MKNAKLVGCNEIDVNNAVMNGAFEGPKIYRQVENFNIACTFPAHAALVLLADT